MTDAGQLAPCPHCGAAHPEEVLICPVTHRTLPLEGRMLDRRFRFVRMLGEGGMSTVWMAENVRVRKHVAIKLMHPEYARNPKTLARFQNEATAAGRIGNPHICDILDFGESPLGPYMVMEMLKGQAFADLLESQGRIDPPLAVLIVSEALKGLAAAHAAGIIHRDLKPENVFLHEPEPGRMLVKLVDFGISKFTEDPGGGKTGANVIMGTPEYMAPEQAAGAANVDARADLWAMGVMLYRAIAGVEPFKGKTMAALLVALSTENPAPLTNYVPSLPPGLVAIVERCLRKKPDERFASAAELVEALAPYQQAVAVGERPVAPPVPPERALSINIDPMTIGSMSIPPQPIPGPAGGTVVAGPGGGVPGGTVVAGPGAGHVAAPHAFAPTLTTSSPIPGMPPMPPAGPAPGPGPSARPGGPPLRPPPGVAEGATWSTELDPNVQTNEQSWGSQGLRTFSDEEGRPEEHRRKSGGGWVGWVIGVTTLGLLVGGGLFAWQAGLFGGGEGKQVASTSGDEAGGDTADEGTVASGTTSSGTTTGELPAEGTTSGTTTGELPAEGTTSGTTSGGEPGTTTSTTSTTGEPASDDDGSDGTTSGGSTSGGSTSGGSTSGGSTSGGSTSDGSTSGGSSSGGDGDGGDDDGPKIELAKLHRVGSLYTPKEKGPAGTYAAAKSHCASLKKNKKFGLTGWRMASTTEILTFKAVVDKLQYWGSETEAANAKVVTVLNGRIGSLPQTDAKPRAFCVSKR